jgi:hypothetical protein
MMDVFNGDANVPWRAGEPEIPPTGPAELPQQDIPLGIPAESPPESVPAPDELPPSAPPEEPPPPAE